MGELYKGYYIDIVQDESPQDPREWDNLTKIICFHRNYSLGDEHNYSIEDFQSETYDETFAKLEKQVRKDYNVVGEVHRIRMYEHSGIGLAIRPSKIATYPFNCRWDSGWVGVMFATREGVATCMGWKRITKKRREQLHKSLLAEFDTYNSYVQGEVYGFQIFEGSEEGEMLDSCWGFIGDSDYCKKEAESIVDSIIENKNKQPAEVQNG